MADLYDAIESGCLKADTSPSKIPEMLEDGQTIDRWKIHINDFSESISYLKPYFKAYVNVWKSYIPVRTKAFGRLENPDPFLKKSIEMTGNALGADDFHKALFDNVRQQNKQGISDKSKAFDDAMKQVTEVDPIEGYKIVDGLDEYERATQKPFILKNNEIQGRKKPAQESHARWLNRAIDLLEGENMKRGKIYLKIGKEEGREDSTIRKAIKKGLDLYEEKKGS